MRHVVLTDDGFNVAQDAYHRMLAACYFPENTRDQLQGLFIAGLERDEFLRVGEENYQPSEIMTAAARLIENRTAQHYSVGLVAISFVWLHHEGLKPSLNRAAIIASTAACEFGWIKWQSGLDPRGKAKRKSVTGDAATVERLFRRYRSVAHICAAQVAAGGYLEPSHVWEQTSEVTEAMIKTAASFQNALEQVTDVSGWNLWDTKKFFPASLSDAPVLVPDDDLMHWIERGYETAVEQGMIKKPEGGDASLPPG